MSDFKPGDIVRQRTGEDWEFFHVERVHANGSIDALTDAGRPAGLNSNRASIEKATLADLLEHRAAQEST